MRLGIPNIRPLLNAKRGSGRARAESELEVADIFRDHGAAWRASQCRHVGLDQMKAMRRDRALPAALGGRQALRGEACAHTVVAYNSCRSATAPSVRALPPRVVGRARSRTATGAELSCGVHVPAPIADIACRTRRRSATYCSSLGRDHAHDRGRFNISALASASCRCCTPWARPEAPECAHGRAVVCPTCGCPPFRGRWRDEPTLKAFRMR